MDGRFEIFNGRTTGETLGPLIHIDKGSSIPVYRQIMDRIIDLEAGVWYLALGHNHPRINEAIRAQMDRVVHIGFPYTVAVGEAAAGAVLGP